MNRWRLSFWVGLLCLMLVAGYAAAFAGLALCSPETLPGDEWWALRTRLADALALVALGDLRSCFMDSAPGAALLHAARLAAPAMLATAAAGVLWELAGVRARQTLLGRWGGHAILAGDARTLRRLSEAESRKGGTLFVALDRAAARSLQRWRPFREVAVLDDGADAGHLLRRLGIGKARLVAAATGSDLANIAMCEAALDAASPAELLLRLEQPSVRVLGSQPLRQRAAAHGVVLTSLSLTQLQVRRGAALAMPGRYVDEAAPRQHIVVCGGGPGVQEAAFHVARQGYGLEAEKPLLTLLRTGRTDFAAGTLDRLVAARDAVDVSLAAADAGDALALDRSMTGAALNSGRITAIHCLGEHPGEAQALALRWERVLLALQAPIPPIVAYGGYGVPGATGMIRIARRVDLADGGAFARTMDQRARLNHERYAESQKRAMGADYGKRPSEADWDRLHETFQDDNRNVADHIDYKLARVGLVSAPNAPGKVKLSPAEIEILAAAEHARWTAAKAAGGWRYGETRDDTHLLHPDMKPYDALDEDARRKDREEIERLGDLLSLGGESLLREVAMGAVVAAGGGADGAAVVRAIAGWSGRHPDARALVRLPLDGEGPLALAESLIAAGVAIEVVQDRQVFAVLAETHEDTTLARAAAILRQAARIRIVTGRTAREAIAAECPLIVDSGGGIHAEAIG